MSEQNITILPNGDYIAHGERDELPTFDSQCPMCGASYIQFAGHICVDGRLKRTDEWPEIVE